jgi:hypothetical protein
MATGYSNIFEGLAIAARGVFESLHRTDENGNDEGAERIKKWITALDSLRYEIEKGFTAVKGNDSHALSSSHEWMGTLDMWIKMTQRDLERRATDESGR